MFADRVQDTTTTTGTGDLTLTGTPPTAKVSFNAAFGTNFRFTYCIQHQTLGDYEVGYGYLSASTTLVRERIIVSSNSNAVVSLAAGTKDVFCTVPAEQVTAPGVALAMAMGWIKQ